MPTSDGEELRQQQQQQQQRQEEEIATSPLQMLIGGIESGSVILFNRKCLQMGDPIGVFLCMCAKVTSPWDHVGLLYDANHLLQEPRELGEERGGAAARADLAPAPPSSASEAAIKEAIRAGAQGSSSSSSSSPRSGIYVAEINMKGFTLRPIEDRVRRTRSHEIAIRRLHVPLSAAAAAAAAGKAHEAGEAGEVGEVAKEEGAEAARRRRRREFDDFLADHLDASYKSFIFDFLASIAYPPDKQERITAARAIGALLAKRAAIDQVRGILRSPIGSSGGGGEGARAAAADAILHVASDEVEKELLRIRGAFFSNGPAPPEEAAEPAEPPGPLLYSLRWMQPKCWLDGVNDAARGGNGVFCSELCATAWQRLGALLPYPPASSYSPYDFAQPRSNEALALVGGATLGPHVAVPCGGGGGAATTVVEFAAASATQPPHAARGAAHAAAAAAAMEAAELDILKEAITVCVDEPQQRERLMGLVLAHTDGQGSRESREAAARRVVEEAAARGELRCTRDPLLAALDRELAGHGSFTLRGVPSQLLVVGAAAAAATLLTFPLQLKEQLRSLHAHMRTAATATAPTAGCHLGVPRLLGAGSSLRLAAFPVLRAITGCAVHGALIVAYCAALDWWTRAAHPADGSDGAPRAGAAWLEYATGFFLDPRHPYTILITSAAALGVVASVATYPLEVLYAVHLASATVVVAPPQQRHHHHHPPGPTSLWKAAAAHHRAHGVRGWWKGCRRHLLLLVPYLGLGHWFVYAEAVAPLLLPSSHVPSLLRRQRGRQSDCCPSSSSSGGDGTAVAGAVRLENAEGVAAVGGRSPPAAAAAAGPRASSGTGVNDSDNDNDSVQRGAFWLRLGGITLAATGAHSAAVYASESCRRYDLVSRAAAAIDATAVGAPPLNPRPLPPRSAFRFRASFRGLGLHLLRIPLTASISLAAVVALQHDL